MTDDELLDRLTAAFDAPAAEPPAASIQSLRDLVDVTISHQRPRVRPRRWAIPAALACVVFGGSGVAYAVSPAVNSAARQFAHAIGLPVDSPQLDDARHHRDELRAALHSGDGPVIARAAGRLRDDLQNLDDHEKNQVGDADSLLQEADQRNQTGQDDHNSNEGGTPTSDAPTSTGGGSPTPSGDGNVDTGGHDDTGPPAPTTITTTDNNNTGPDSSNSNQPDSTATTDTGQG